jgi:hypothetical protein
VKINKSAAASGTPAGTRRSTAEIPQQAFLNVIVEADQWFIAAKS